MCVSLEQSDPGYHLYPFTFISILFLQIVLFLLFRDEKEGSTF